MRGARRPDPPRMPMRPGPVAWVVIAAGVALMAWALLGVVGDADETNPRRWFLWVVGAAVLHDAVLLPAVLVVGALLASWRRRGMRVALRLALAVGGIVTLVALPVVGRFGEKPANPSLLPLPAGRNLAVLWAVLLIGAVAVGFVADLGGRATDGSEGDASPGRPDPAEDRR